MYLPVSVLVVSCKVALRDCGVRGKSVVFLSGSITCKALITNLIRSCNLVALAPLSSQWPQLPTRVPRNQREMDILCRIADEVGGNT
jgi:hypothetical protein